MNWLKKKALRAYGKLRRRLRRLKMFFHVRAAHLRLGRRGETMSCRALSELGLEILDRNVRNRHGEIDIVARDKGVLCFIEVKTRRRGSGFGRPADAVDHRRQVRLSRAANLYMRKLGEDVEVPYRFDIVEVLYEGSRLDEITYLRSAFSDRTVRRRAQSGRAYRY